MLKPERHSLGSQITQPSINFSQVGETIAMLALTIAQIETSMKEGDKSDSCIQEEWDYKQEFTYKKIRPMGYSFSAFSVIFIRLCIISRRRKKKDRVWDRL